MVSRVRTINFLPDIFKTTPNEQFLSATLDQLVSQPNTMKLQGYIGSKFGYGINAGDGYIVEPNKIRKDYQLEPSVIFLKKNTATAVDMLTYPGIIDALAAEGSITNQHDDLFSNQFYSWDSFVELDKLINHNQYYWLPSGPDVVTVGTNDVYNKTDYTVISTDNFVTFGANNLNVPGENPTLTLLRGGTYRFFVNQTSKFWIQGAPGINGTDPVHSNLSVREIFGLTNNGISNGTMTFTVPYDSDQASAYYPGSQTVDLMTTLPWESINGKPLNELGNIDGISSLEGRSLLFFGNPPTARGFIGDFYDTTPYGDPEDFENGVYSTLNKNTYLVTYVGDPDNPIIKLVEYKKIIQFDKIKVLYGDENAYKEVYTDEFSNMFMVPYLSALENTLYYQDGSNPNRVGIIKILDAVIGNGINVETEILNKTQYTSPNGVRFTNGLRVTFTGNVSPEEYIDGDYYVEGVGTGIALLPVQEYIVPEPFGKAFYAPYDISPYDSVNYDGSINVPLTKDHITINRNSADRNAWSRSNRWFHIDVLRATATYRNNEAPIVLEALNNPDYRANRPIVEFYPNLKLFNQGSVARGTVDFIDTVVTDPFGFINSTPICAGATSFNPNAGLSSIPDNVQIVFANAEDPDVRNKIYKLKFVSITGSSNPVITLSELQGGNILANEQIVVTKGDQVGQTYHYDGEKWELGQLKDRVNQAPMYNIFDPNNISYSEQEYYLGSSFRGCSLFQYAVGTGKDDPVLGFPVRYSSVTNLGDITFNVSLNTDTFDYVEGFNPITKNVDNGYVWKYVPETKEYTRQIGWQTAVGESFQYQAFELKYESGIPMFICDIPFKDPSTTNWQVIQVYVNNSRLTPDKYTKHINEKNETVVTLNTVPNSNVPVEILIYSDIPSKTGYYRIPDNLQLNPFNAPVTDINVGDIRGHYKSICNNITALEGDSFGANNFRDLGNLVPYGTKIIQNSASLVPAAAFLRNQDYSIFNALNFNSNEYVKFKTLLIDTISRTEYSRLNDDSFILEDAMSQIGSAKSDSNAFFWTDMLATGNRIATNSYTFVNFIKQTEFPLTKIYDFENANYNGVLVYIKRKESNGITYTTQILRGYDYDISKDEPKLILYFDLLPNDTVIINEYAQTYGSYVPSTPTKLGLYPSFVPTLVYDESYVNPTWFIKGHDGSLTKIYGIVENGRLQDYRDRALLEFEKRIFNNLKLSNVIPLSKDDIFPGYFRQTDYTYNQTQQIYSQCFLNWIGKNRIDFKSQYYDVTDEYTYNYSQSLNKIDYKPIQQGNWRGIYLWLYDTSTPHVTPWEMLGFVDKPVWWETRYGAAPYTSDNTLLWGDIESGLVWNNGSTYINQKKVRPGLSNMLPVDSYGELRGPMQTIVGSADPTTLNRNWQVGDVGPAEFSYLNSSSWPFDLMRIFALTKPAKFFALGLNVDTYEFNAEFNQYLENARLRSPLNDLVIYGNGTAVHSYVNWIVDYVQQIGMNGHDKINELITNLDVRLTYRIAGFSDKNLLKFFVEKGSPNSKNSSLLIPDESYGMLLYNNQPFSTITYSSVIIQKSVHGYKVFGNSQNFAYFRTLTPKLNGNYDRITVGDVSIQLSKEYTNDITTIPYGTEYHSIQSLSEFLLNYGRYLEQSGMIFDNVENGIVENWEQMVAETMYWAQSGWEVGSTVNVNPAATVLKIDKESSIVQPLTLHQQNYVLNQNLVPIQTKDMNIYRNGTEFKINVLKNEDTFSYLTANLSNMEHCVIFDNVTLFNDTIYNLITGLRQQRILVKGVKTAEWNGQVDAQGFILNQDNIQEWREDLKYTKGSIVKYKNSYYASTKSIQPAPKFNETEWVKTEYEKIQRGLISNPSTRSFESTLYYDIHNTNLENDADLLSFSLIGYRPRDYLAVANLDDVTQVNVFLNMIKSLGTMNAADKLKNITVPQGKLGYDVYENWAVKTGDFGGVLNHNFIEFNLNEAKLKGNPAIVGITNGKSISGVEQEIPMYTLTNYGQLSSSVDILPTVYDVDDNKLPDAGYVNFNDVKVFSYNFDGLPSASVPIQNLYKTDYIWMANHRGEWGTYTPVALGSNNNESVLLSVVDNNLNDRATFTFTKPHNLRKHDLIGILNFNSKIDGYYEVQDILNQVSVTVSLSLPTSSPLKSNGIGISFKLEPVRVDNGSQIASTPSISYEFDRTKVWVDRDTTNDWAVYEKDIRYNIENFVKPSFTDSFGSSATFIENYGYFMGDKDAGKVYVFEYNAAADQYVNTNIITRDIGFGSSIQKSNNTLVIGNEIEGKVHVFRMVNEGRVTALVEDQVIVNTPTVGKSIAMSGDDNWLYISDTENNEVLVYQLDYDYAYTDTTLTLENAVVRNDTTFTTVGNVASQFTPGVLVAFFIDVFVATPTETYMVLTSKWDPGSNITTVTLTTPFKTAYPKLNEIFIATVNYSAAGSAWVGNVRLPDSEPGDNFGFRVSTNHDGSTVFVSAPNRDYSGEYTVWEANTDYLKDTVIKHLGLYYLCTSNVVGTATFELMSPLLRAFSDVGYVFAFERLTQVWDQQYNAKPFVTGYLELFWTASSVMPTPMAFLNGRQLIEASDYDILLDTVLVFITLNAGDVFTVSGSTFIHKQTFTYYNDPANAQNGSATGYGLDCNLFGNEVMVGVPYLVTPNGRDGALYRFTDAGKQFGTIIGTKDTNVLGATKILLNGSEVVINGDAATVASQINGYSINNVYAMDLDGKLAISLYDADLNPAGNKLTISVLDKSVLDALGIEVYKNTQVLEEIYTGSRSQFGSNIQYNEHNSFVVNAPVTTRREAVRFDYTFDNTDNDTIFDNNFTQFMDTKLNAGAVYMYDYISRYDENINDMGQYVFAQSCNDYTFDYGFEPNYGESLYFGNSQLLIGTPKFSPGEFNGRVIIYKNKQNKPNWSVLRSSSKVVDISRLEGVHLYNNTDNTTIESLDYMDPLQGRLLGSVRDNIDIITSVDPAGYNMENSSVNVVWGASHVGTIWLDVSRIRFVNYHQGDVVYDSQHWGKVFPGSDIAVYSWIESMELPAFYSGPGVPYDLEKYSTSVGINSAGNLLVKYYYWVRNTGTLFTSKNKTLADKIIASYIQDPQASGISYFTPYSPSVYGIYNSRHHFNTTDTSLHIGFSLGENKDTTHGEFKLIRDGFETDFLPGIPNITNDWANPTSLYDRMLDSMSGLDEFGAPVPDTNLPRLMQRGVSSRPRQTFFINRFGALENYLKYANRILASFPIVESKSPTFLTKKGSINRTTRLPFYDTSTVWEYTDWWEEGYSNAVKTSYDVPKYYYLETLTPSEGLLVGVESNSDGKREVYIYENSEWRRVGLEDGTIQFKDILWDYAKNRIGFGDNFFDTAPYDFFPAEETRYVIRALNEEIYVDDLMIHRNQSLILLFEYIQSENIESQNYLPWLTKTSFVDVSHTIRQLKKYEKFQRDNVDFLFGYMNEVKPYHVILKEFYLKYDGNDTYDGVITDFDLPSTYSSITEKFVSPNLVYNTQSTAADFYPSSSIWESPEYRNWYANYGLTITGQKNVKMSLLKVQLDLLPDNIIVDNAYGYPVQGFIRINEEIISYTGVNRELGILTGISRGLNGTAVATHSFNSFIYMDIPKIVVFDSGRGYIDPPVITATIDTSIYPAPRKHAKFRAIMQIDKVIGVQVIDEGEGYVVTPTLEFQPSLVVAFDSDNINYESNILTIPSTALVTGDSIKIEMTGLIPGIINNAYYYVRILGLTDDKAVIALYQNQQDAFTNSNKIEILAPNSRVTGTLNLSPRASLVMGPNGVRSITPLLKFDRTSYNPMVTEWVAGDFYSSGITLTNASSSLELSVAQPYLDMPKMNRDASGRATFSISNSYLAGNFNVISVNEIGSSYAAYTTGAPNVQPIGLYVNGSSSPWNAIWIRATDMDPTWAEYGTTAGITVKGVLTSASLLPSPLTSSDGDAYLAPDDAGVGRIWICVNKGTAPGAAPPSWNSNADNSCVVLITGASGGGVSSYSIWGTPGIVTRSSLQGALFPILDVYENNSRVVVKVDMKISGMSMGQLKNMRLYFYQKIDPYVYDDTSRGGAKFNVYRPKFTPTQVVKEYVVTIINPGSIYQVGDVITIPGSAFGFGSVDIVNDATITVTSITPTNAIQEVYVSGVSVAEFKSYYVNPISQDEFVVFNDINLSSPTPLARFPFVGGVTTNVSQATAANDVFTVENATLFSVGNPVRFGGAVFGGVVAGRTYYIRRIISATLVTISETINGPVFNIAANAAGFMTLSRSGDNAFVSDPAVATAGPRIGYVNYVVYNNQVYQCVEDTNDTTFLYDQWRKVDSDSLLFNALDRIVGFYEPTTNMPGKNLNILLNGIRFSENTYYGNVFAPEDQLPIEVNLKGQSFYPSDIDLKSVIFDGQYYLAVGETATTTSLIKSTDGVTWSLTTIAAQNIKVKDITYDGSTYVITAENRTTPVLVSFDTERWFSSGAFTPFDSLGYDVVGYDSSAVNVNNMEMHSDTYGMGMFVAVGKRYILTSNNALTWRTAFDFGTEGSVLQSITNVNITHFDGFIAVGTGFQMTGTGAATGFISSGVIVTSADGAIWSQVSPLIANVGFYGVTSNSNIAVAVGQRGVIYYTTNGSNWFSVSSPTTDDLNDVFYSSIDGIFVAVGEAGTILTSLNGTSWVSRDSTVTTNLYGIQHDGNRFVAVGDNSTILFSNTGVNWEAVGALSAKDPFYDVQGAPFEYGYSPEEMVSGVVSDNLSLYVRSRPSGNWDYETYGHTGFEIASKTVEPDFNGVVSFDRLVDIPYTMSAYIVDSITNVGTRIYDVSSTNARYYYTIDWINKTIKLIEVDPSDPSRKLTSDETILVEVYGVGGSNQIAKDNTDNVPLRVNNISNTSEIYLNYNYDNTVYAPPLCYVNGKPLTYLVDFFLDTTPERITRIAFKNLYTQGVDYIAYTVFGDTTSPTQPEQYGGSLPSTDVFVGDGVTTTYALSNFVYYASPLNPSQQSIVNDTAIVEINGLRTITPTNITFNIIPTFNVLVSASTTGLFKVSRTLYPDISNVLPGATLRIGDSTLTYTITASAVDPVNSTLWNLSIAQAVDANPDDMLSISATITFAVAPVTGDSIAITTFGDTRQQSLVLDVNIGKDISQIYYVDNSSTPVRIYITIPVTGGQWADGTEIKINGLIGSEQLNNGNYYVKYLTSTVYSLFRDAALTIPVSSSLITNYVVGGYAWDASQQNIVSQQLFKMTDPTRTWVTINGERLSSQMLRYDDNNNLSILAPVIDTDLVCITSMIPTATPNELVYNLNVNKYEKGQVYRSNNNSSTWLTKELAITDDTVYINDASRLVDSIEQKLTVLSTANNILYVPIQAEFDSIREVTVYNVNLMAQLNPSDFTFTMFQATPSVLFTNNVFLGDEVIITINVGETIVINGERIRFNSIDYANNTVSGLTRGVEGTAALRKHSTYSQVYSLIPTNELNDFYYNKTWNTVLYRTLSASVVATSTGQVKVTVSATPNIIDVRSGASVVFSSSSTVYKVTASYRDLTDFSRWVIQLNGSPAINVGEVATITYVFSGQPIQMSSTDAAKFLRTGAI